MPALEQLLFVLLGAAGLLCVLPRASFGVWAFRCAAAGVGVAIIDVVLGNWRWQLVPLLVLMAATLILAYVRSRSGGSLKPRTRSRTLVASAAALLFGVLLAAALVPLLAFPMFEAPAPTGAYDVGITDLHLVDTARAETMTDDPDDRRELMVRVWYPARAPDGARPEPFLREVEPLRHIFARGMPYLRPFMLGHLRRIPSHSYLDAPLVEEQGRLPVLIFSHGNSFYASQNSLLMEDLASHGYVVFSIEHPYQASWVKFPDGRIAWYRDQWNVEGTVDPAQVRREEEIFYRALYADDYEHYRQQLTELIAGSPGANKGLQLWVADTALLLDELAQTGSGHAAVAARFKGRLDLDRVGLFGMSYGGAAAGEFCSQDARCKAGLNMDGLQYGAAGTDIKIEQPFMFLYADRRPDAAARIGGVDTAGTVPFDMNEFVWRQARGRAYSLTIAGATHMSFSDFAFAAAVFRKSGVLGTIDPELMRTLLNDAVLAFFNETLKGTHEPLLEGALEQRPGVLEFVRRDGRVPSVE